MNWFITVLTWLSYASPVAGAIACDLTTQTNPNNWTNFLWGPNLLQLCVLLRSTVALINLLVLQISSIFNFYVSIGLIVAGLSLALIQSYNNYQTFSINYNTAQFFLLCCIALVSLFLYSWAALEIIFSLLLWGVASFALMGVGFQNLTPQAGLNLRSILAYIVSSLVIVIICGLSLMTPIFNIWY